MRRNQWLTDRSTLSNWLTDTQSEAKKKVALSRSTETLSSSPLLMGLAIGVIGLECFGFNPVVQSEAPLSAFSSEIQFEAHPLLYAESPEGVGLDGFGNPIVLSSYTPQSEFIDTVQLRDHWFQEIGNLSNWRTQRMNEEFEPVRLEGQLYDFSASPLLFDGLSYILGLMPFGINLFSKSGIPISIEEDLLDTLATEDFDPIVTEDEMDEIALG